MNRPAYLCCPHCGEVIGTVALRPDGSVRRLTAETERPPGLTSRQWDVLRAAMDGKQDKEIARELGLSKKTVKNHFVNIFDRLGCSNRVAAVAIALRRELGGAPVVPA